MSRLLSNLHKMTRVELNNLAKNKYCDDEIQIWIAQHAHIQARYYLAQNPSVCKEAVTIMLNSRSRIVKGLLVGSSVVDDEDKIREVYSQLRLKVNNWRVSNFFVHNYWSAKLDSRTHTPSDVLERIYDDYLQGLRENSPAKYWWKHLKKRIAMHHNCSLQLAIRLSQDKEPDIQKAGFDALVRLNAEKD